VVARTAKAVCAEVESAALMADALPEGSFWMS
jgi:hypothetical protein